MQINFIYDNSVQSAPIGFKQGLAIAANIIDAIILDPITITIAIGYGEDNGSQLAPNTLGEAQPSFGVLLSLNELVAGLTGASTSADDARVLQNLPATDPTNGKGFFVSAAQALAWGVIPATANQVDGYAGFSSSLAFTYDPSNGIAPGTYDFVGVALHELTHALGRNVTPSYLTPLDLLGYGISGNLDTNNLDLRYFSPDGGKTNLGYFDTTSDQADFAVFGPSDSFNASLNKGTSLSWTTLDSRLMDVLGYHTAAAASPPAPAPTPPLTPKVSSAFVPISNFLVIDTSTNTTSNTNGEAYTGPVQGIQFQFISATNKPLTITSTVSNVFIRSGSGMDAISVANSSGRNVLDGGSGSNFLVGSLTPAARDTFFVDDRSATADTWSTVFNMHAGDGATVWGLSPGDRVSWVDGQGAPGFQGLTLHATQAGKPNASLTLTGYTSADLRNGRLDVGFGTVDGNSFLNINVRGA